MSTPKWRRCPVCPGCKAKTATPVKHDGVWLQDRVRAGDTLWCPVCGESWAGTPGDLVKATKAYAAYERHLAWKERQPSTAAKRQPRGVTPDLFAGRAP